MSEYYTPGWRLINSLEKSCKMIQTYKGIIEDSFTKPKIQKANSLSNSTKSMISLDSFSYLSKLWTNNEKKPSTP